MLLPLLQSLNSWIKTYVQCLLLKCRPQHSSLRWQLLIAKVLAVKSKSIPLLLGGLQLGKITKQYNHVPYNMRSWKCSPTSATHFWHHFRKCVFTQINSVSEIQSISQLILAFNSSNGWGFIAYTLFFKCPHR